MYPGKYKLYILANMKDYAYDNTGASKKTISASLTEQEIKDMTLKFTGPIAPGNLHLYLPPGLVKDINNSNAPVYPEQG
ncbi:MAG: hypothetical protein K2H15_02070, partial [Muribaculaceae bacterium]|nr:hypothetical protein [Muribaculaceae bacterium]